MLRERRRHAHYKLNTRLDRKSSRGMIYENEELRLRTININAEVERGQTDIKRLRKENDQLRREIWTLRDECDRLNKRVKTKFMEHDNVVYSTRCGGANSCSCQYPEGVDGCTTAQSRCNSEDSDSCDSCCCHGQDEAICNDECCTDIKKIPASSEADRIPAELSKTETKPVSVTEDSPTVGNSKLNNFDHLSVVSEETLSNSELVLTHHVGNLFRCTPDISGSHATLPNLMGPLTPLTPVELIANELSDLQAVVPPLSYFENVLQQHMSSHYGSTPESSSTTNSGQTIVKHTNGWDYNLQSPFAQRRYQVNSVSPIIDKRSPAQTLTTFVPNNQVTAPSPVKIVSPSEKPMLPKKPTILNVSSLQYPKIETVPITTLPPSGNTSQTPTASVSENTIPRHFFAPIKPKLKINTALANQKRLPPPSPPVVESETETKKYKCEPPDIYVTNGLATPYRPPRKPTVHPPPIPQRINSTTSTIQAQTDSANLESILNDIEAISEDILAIQLDKHKPRDKLNHMSTYSNNSNKKQPMPQSKMNAKPYKSEMNLLLTYEDSGSKTNTSRRARSLERDHTDSPSPHVPDPMQPFPDDRNYIGFERLNNALISANSTILTVAATATQTSPLGKKLVLPLSPLATNLKTSKVLPPTPPTRSFPTQLKIKCAGVARCSSLTSNMPKRNPSTNISMLNSMPPNKSQLYATLANAAAKRAQFRSQPTHLTRSLDVPDNTNEDDPSQTRDEKEATENSKRRVSIAGSDSVSTETPAKTSDDAVRNKFSNLQPPAKVTGSCTELHNALTSPGLRILKQTSQSTPNSPHSYRKHADSPVSTPQVTPIISITPTSSPQHQHNIANTSGVASQLLANSHVHSYSYPNVVSPLTQQHQQPRKNSQDTIKASAAEIACAAANALRSKCSRRHSDGTVSHTNQRISGVSGGTNGTHHHHPHSHHHHQHSSSVVSNTNPHHSHHSRRDSNQDTVASDSDRNSNSLASSRESSASFSIRSQRRKLSVSSHTGGKIPWCGCWGNGCL